METVALTISVGDHARIAVLKPNRTSASIRSSTIFFGFDYRDDTATDDGALFFGTGLEAWRKALDFVVDLIA